MSARRPEDAVFERAVENRVLRIIAGWVRRNPLKTGLVIAFFGVLFSVLSLLYWYFVIPDIFIDFLAAVLGMIYIRRIVTGEATLSGSASGSATGTVVKSDDRED